jgi:hypothetical protein
MPARLPTPAYEPPPFGRREPTEPPPPPFGRRERIEPPRANVLQSFPQEADGREAPNAGLSPRALEMALLFRRVRLRALNYEITLAYRAELDDLAPQFLISYDKEGAYLSAGAPVALSLARMGEERAFFAEGDSRALDSGKSAGDLALHTADIAVDMLIGYSIEAVERRLVIRTLRRFKGDFRQTAFALGVSVEELMAKLRLFLFADGAPRLAQPGGG